ncbi:MAG: hypothetical protein QW286_02120, partial [Candidatus Aenigmatarchaeota archaeon]
VQVDNALKEALRGAATGSGYGMQAPQPRYAPVPSPREYYQPPVPRKTMHPAYAESNEPYPQEEYQPQAHPRAYSKIEPSVPEPPLDFEDFKRSNSSLGFPEIPTPEKEPVREIPSIRPKRFAPEETEEEMEEEEEFRPLPRIRRERTRSEVREERKRAFEELAESVVEEKWADFRKRIGEINSRFQEINERVSALEEKISQMQGEKRTDVMEIEQKLDSYKHTMDEIDTRMEAIEKAMKDSLTPMMQTLRSLSETIKALKERKG